MAKIIIPGQVIGIIGGGQLGRMMAISAKEMGYLIAVLDPTLNSPCAQIADIEIVAEYNDLEAIKELASVSDVITYEFENIDYACLKWLEENAYLPQKSQLLSLTQNRLTEKKIITELDLPVGSFMPIENQEELLNGVAVFSYPCVLKTTTGGYDGKGQVVIRSEKDILAASELINQHPCILEDWIVFEKEISVIVARNSLGEMATFPVSENIHVENILYQSIVPARIEREVEQNALAYAYKLAEELALVGTLAIEMFVTIDGEIFINELAPRPHNSGHYTLDACATSQFEQHIRAICNWPLGETKLLSEVVMVNILGEHQEEILQNIPQFNNCKLHLYGKKEVKPKRKMGHVNVLCNTTKDAIKKVESLGIWKIELIVSEEDE